MLAQQFHQAATTARTVAGLDEIARKLWRAHSEGNLSDADAGAIRASTHDLLKIAR